MLNKNYSIKFKLQRKAIALLLPLIFLTFTVCTVHINAQAQDNSKTVAIQAPETTTNNQAPKAQSAQTVTKKQALKAQSVQTTITDEAIAVSQVEVKPKFQDSDEQAFLKWLFQNLQYPQEAKNKGLEGRIICSFTVNAQGKVVDIKVLRGIDPLLDDAAVKTISASPDWTPGQMKGKNVSVKYTIPLIFSLDKKKEEKAK